MIKKISAFILVMLKCAIVLAISAQSNTEFVTISSQSGGQFDQFYFNIGSYNDQTFTISFDQSIADTTPQFKMSINTSTGQVSYLYVTNITAATTNASWSVARTNMTMPVGVYFAEVYTIDSNNDIGLSLARGKVNVTKSLFSESGDVVAQGMLTNLNNYLLITEATNLYVRKAYDFDQFTGLGGTAGQIWISAGDGTGAWADNSNQPIAAGTGIDVTMVGSTQATIAVEAALITTQANNSAELLLAAITNAAQTLAINNNAVTGANHTAEFPILSNYVVSADTIVSNALVSQLQAGDTAVSNSAIALATVVSNGVVAGYQAYGTAVSNAAIAYDTIVSNGVTGAFQASDTAVSNAAIALGTVVSNGVTGAFQLADQAFARKDTTNTFTETQTVPTLVVGTNVNIGTANTITGLGLVAGSNNIVRMFGFSSGSGNTVTNWGFSSGLNNTVGQYGFGAGRDNTVASDGFSSGSGNSAAGQYSFAAGKDNTVGPHGFGAGRRGKGGSGSFVFSDSTNTDFDRSAYIDWFSVRALGGTYFSTPTFEITGNLTVNSNLTATGTVTQNGTNLLDGIVANAAAIIATSNAPVAWIQTIDVVGPTNSFPHYVGLTGAGTLTEVYCQSVGMTGLVQLVKRAKTSTMHTTTNINAAVVLDEDGTTTSAFGTNSILAGELVGAYFTSLSSFTSTNEAIVIFKGTTP